MKEKSTKADTCATKRRENISTLFIWWRMYAFNWMEYNVCATYHNSMFFEKKNEFKICCYCCCCCGNFFFVPFFGRFVSVTSGALVKMNLYHWRFGSVWTFNISVVGFKIRNVLCDDDFHYRYSIRLRFIWMRCH